MFFSKYAGILASQGSVEIAMEYLVSANDQVRMLPYVSFTDVTFLVDCDSLDRLFNLCECIPISHFIRNIEKIVQTYS